MHSKIKALCHRFGISYKDAAHRLYMAEIEKLKMADSTAKSYEMLKERVDDIVSQDIAPIIQEIDNWKNDNIFFIDGIWQMKAE
jgi:hypothetical protein